MALKSISTKLGKIDVLASSEGIIEVSFKKIPKSRNFDDSLQASKQIDKFEIALEKYLAGDSSALTKIDLVIAGTEFQKSVWKQLRKIPHGQTKSYSEVARLIGKKNAARAIGSACGKNKHLLLIPCHRVTSKTGLGGFAAGLKTKIQLLSLEGSFLSN